MSVIPRSLFCNAGNLLLPNVKSVLISLIEGYVAPVPNQNEDETDQSEIIELEHGVKQSETEVVTDIPEDGTDSIENMETEQELVQENETQSAIGHVSEDCDVTHPLPEVERMIAIAQDVYWMDGIELSDEVDRVALIDAMAVVQGIKKTPTMKKMSDFRDVFIKKVQRRAKGYSETRVLFDEYLDNSLKENTRVKRAEAKNKTKNQPIEINYRINENRSLAAVSLKSLLTSTKTKRNLTEFLAEGLLQHFTGPIVVVQGGTARSNLLDVTEELQTHSHEEADTLIPLHVLDVCSNRTMVHVDIHCSDTDILLLLMDLVANDRHGSTNKISMVKTGKFKGKSSVDVVERVQVLGTAKARGLVGFHNFTGADWGGKFVGISKETWMKAYLELPDHDDALPAFQRLGTISLSVTDYSDKLPANILPLESFLCSVYAPTNCFTRSIPDLRYELFRSKNLEAEKLPPILPTFFLHVLRSNFVSMRDKSYTTANPNLPLLEASGWEKIDGKYTPLRCLLPPAPKSVLELVKCGCDPSKGCNGNCSCLKNKLPCTPLCKCYTTGCELFPKYKRDTKDVEEEDENFF